MTEQAGQMLIDQIAPRLRSAIPSSVTAFGGEDVEELVQDGLAIAAQMLHSVEAAGKTVTPGNIAYYTMLQLKSGRRSQSGSRCDVLAAATQLDQNACVISIEDEVGYDPELDEPITLAEVLTSREDDPATIAARNVDWNTFIQSHDYRYGVILKGMAEGRTLKETASECGMGIWPAYHLQDKMRLDLRVYLGPDALADSLQAPQWKTDKATEKEREMCRAEQRG